MKQSVRMTLVSLLAHMRVPLALLMVSMVTTHTIVAAQRERIGKKPTPSNTLFNRVIKVKIHGIEERIVPTNKSLIILLDDGEYHKGEIGAITQELAWSIIAGCCPIVCSTSLVANMVKQAHTPDPSFDTLKSLSLEDLQVLKLKELVQRAVKELNSSTSEGFNWIIRRIALADGLLVLIPRGYLITHKINTPDELDLHAPLSFKQPVTLENLDNDYMLFLEDSNQLKEKEERSRHFKDRDYKIKNIDYTFMTSMGRLFMGNEEAVHRYTVNKNALPTQWSIYMSGHGGDGTVAGLAIVTFAQFLDFLNYHIYTKLLLYSTCFSAGTTQDKLYQNEGKMSKRTYGFPIISFGIVEAPIAMPINNIQLKALVEKMESAEPVRYTDLLTDFNPELALLLYTKIPEHRRPSFFSDLREQITNFPLIRPPQSMYFMPFIPIAEIGDILVGTRSADAPLDIKQFWKQKINLLNLVPSQIDPRIQMYIILSTSYVPFPLELTVDIFKEEYPFFVAIKGAITVFEKFTFHGGKLLSQTIRCGIRGIQISDLFVGMFGGLTFLPEATFVIKELVCEDFGEYQTFTNVVIHKFPAEIHTSKISWEVYYTDEKGKRYKATLPYEQSRSSYEGAVPQLITDDYLKKYAAEIASTTHTFTQKTTGIQAIAASLRKKHPPKSSVAQLIRLQNQLSALAQGLT